MALQSKVEPDKRNKMRKNDVPECSYPVILLFTFYTWTVTAVVMQEL